MSFRIRNMVPRKDYVTQQREMEFTDAQYVAKMLIVN